MAFLFFYQNPAILLKLHIRLFVWVVSPMLILILVLIQAHPLSEILNNIPNRSKALTHK